MPPLSIRATAIVGRPRNTWGRIATESTSVVALYVAYVVPLAALAPLATYVCEKSGCGTGRARRITYLGYRRPDAIPLLVRIRARRRGARRIHHRSFVRAFRIAAYAHPGLARGRHVARVAADVCVRPRRAALRATERRRTPYRMPTDPSRVLKTRALRHRARAPGPAREYRAGTALRRRCFPGRRSRMR